MTLLLIAAVMAFAAEPAPTGSVDTTAAAIVADCNARKFETSVEIDKAGEKRLTKLKLCAAKDADDASWVRTLEDAKRKIAAHPEISGESKMKIAAEIDSEIAKIQAGKAAAMPVAVPAPLTAAPETTTKPAQATALPVRGPAGPSLSIRCVDFGDTGEGNPCLFLERSTRLAIRAEEDLAGGARLRFLRRGDARGEVAIAAIRRGQSVQARLPDQLCVGVSSSKVEIQILSSGKVVQTLGPYRLRC
jgi:hypothetical protein